METKPHSFKFLFKLFKSINVKVLFLVKLLLSVENHIQILLNKNEKRLSPLFYLNLLFQFR